MTVLGIIIVKYDGTLDSFQKKSQTLFVLFMPIFGSAFVIYLVNLHSPEVIPKNWIPWPISRIIFGKERASNRDRDDNEEPGINLSINEGQHGDMGDHSD